MFVSFKCHKSAVWTYAEAVLKSVELPAGITDLDTCTICENAAQGQDVLLYTHRPDQRGPVEGIIRNGETGWGCGVRTLITSRMLLSKG